MTSRFLTCLTGFTWRPENDGQPPHTTSGDAGALTSWGMTYTTYCAAQNALGKPSPSQAQFIAFPKETFIPIYQTNFWNAVVADSLPVGLDLMVWDFGVVAGPHRAIEALQSCLGLISDGEFGPRTTSAVADRAAVIDFSVYLSHQLAFYKACAAYPVDGRGWTRRAQDALTQARQDVTNALTT